MLWAPMLAYVTGTVNQELLLRNEYLAAENRILKGQIKGRRTQCVVNCWRRRRLCLAKTSYTYKMNDLAQTSIRTFSI